MPSKVPGTAVIGRPIRDESEIALGSNLSIRVAAPGGTAGKTYVSNFRHETYVSPTDPTPPPGLFLIGSFSITTTPAEVVLETSTDLLAPGRFVYDIVSTEPNPVSGQPSIVSTSSLREFIVNGSITSAGTGTAPLPPDGGLAGLIATHNSDPDAHGGLSGGGVAEYEITFTDADLSSGDILVKLHGLPSRPSGVLVYDADDATVDPSWVRVSQSAIEIDFSDFRPLAGTWRLSAVK